MVIVIIQSCGQCLHHDPSFAFGHIRTAQPPCASNTFLLFVNISVKVNAQISFFLHQIVSESDLSIHVGVGGWGCRGRGEQGVKEAKHTMVRGQKNIKGSFLKKWVIHLLLWTENNFVSDLVSVWTQPINSSWHFKTIKKEYECDLVNFFQQWELDNRQIHSHVYFSKIRTDQTSASYLKL